MTSGRGKAKGSKKGGENSMGFKVPTSREQIGDPLDKYSDKHDISPNQPLFVKGEKEIRLLL